MIFTLIVYLWIKKIILINDQQNNANKGKFGQEFKSKEYVADENLEAYAATYR